VAVDSAPWVWEPLSLEERRERWRDLEAWVEWLRRAFEGTVELPACWPDHIDLRSELVMFRYWHMHAFKDAATPAEGVRWLQSLRVSAESWRQRADCMHEPPLSFVAGSEQQRRATVRQYVDKVIDQPVLKLPEGDR
jgi:hypothetical protein